MKKWILLWIILLIPNVSSGQSRQFAWEQEATSAEAASSFIYKYYLDGRVNGTVLIGVKCSGTTSPFTCTTSTPAFTAGNHTVQITTTADGIESEKGAPFLFTMAILSPPRAIRFR